MDPETQSRARRVLFPISLGFLLLPPLVSEALSDERWEVNDGRDSPSMWLGDGEAKMTNVGVRRFGLASCSGVPFLVVIRSHAELDSVSHLGSILKCCSSLGKRFVRNMDLGTRRNAYGRSVGRMPYERGRDVVRCTRLT